MEAEDEKEADDESTAHFITGGEGLKSKITDF